MKIGEGSGQQTIILFHHARSPLTFPVNHNIVFIKPPPSHIISHQSFISAIRIDTAKSFIIINCYCGLKAINYTLQMAIFIHIQNFGNCIWIGKINGSFPIVGCNNIQKHNVVTNQSVLRNFPINLFHNFMCIFGFYSS